MEWGAWVVWAECTNLSLNLNQKPRRKAGFLYGSIIFMKLLQTLMHSERFPHFLAILSCVLFAIAGIAINLHKFWQYETGYYDFGIFDVPIWKVAHFQAPIIDHFVVPEKWNLADHFNPSIYLFAPIYWFTNRSEALLIAKNIVVALSGYVLYRIGNNVLKNSLVSLSVLISYFLFTGLQNAVYSDFHEVTVMTLFLMLTYWAIIKGNKKLFFLFFIITLGFKESLFLLGIGLSFFIFFYRRDWRKIAIISFFYSLIYGYLVIKVIMPALAGGFYAYNPEVPTTIPGLLQSLVTPTIKVKTVFWSFLSFLFLPILSWTQFPIILFHYVSRFLTPGSTRWDLGFHYNAEIAPTLAVGTIIALQNLREKLSPPLMYGLAIVLVGVSVFLFRFVLPGTFLLAVHPVFYANTKNFSYIDEAVAKVPDDGSLIVAQNNLTSRFFHRDVRILRDDHFHHKPDYILIDLRDSQNPANFFGMSHPDEVLKRIKEDTRYKIIHQNGELYLFKRIKE